ncbi:hypothetical protein N7499_000003, partial [Penicillium canescens]
GHLEDSSEEKIENAVGRTSKPPLEIFLVRGHPCFLYLRKGNEFKIPEIIFNLTLALSPYVCLLGMLFYIRGFKIRSSTGLVLNCLENLYRLRVLEGLGQ